MLHVLPTGTGILFFFLMSFITYADYDIIWKITSHSNGETSQGMFQQPDKKWWKFAEIFWQQVHCQRATGHMNALLASILFINCKVFFFVFCKKEDFD